MWTSKQQYWLVILSVIILQISSTITASTNWTNSKFIGFDFLKHGRIINGTFALQNVTGHQISVRRRLIERQIFGTGHICGASLIAPNIALSAAHCFVDTKTNDGSFLPIKVFTLVMGNLNRLERKNSLVFTIKSISYPIKDKFDLDTYFKDIALIQLNDSVPLDHPTVKPIPLASKPVPPGTICQVTGWGNTEKGVRPKLLMTVDVPIIPFNVCTSDIHSDFSKGQIMAGMFCAGYLDLGERDACGGDSGGPLVCEGHQMGIVSWGDGCALPRSPGVYTNVTYYYPWIEQELKRMNLTLDNLRDADVPIDKENLLLSDRALIALLFGTLVFLNEF